jgi:tripartite-type tricarboxylate transporter receptor subunit TctC
MKKMLLITLIMTSVASFAFANGSSEQKETDAQNWPNAPVQVVVGANAGGGIDTAARLMCKYLEQELGTSFVVSNMSGGAGSIAANHVKNSKADGYTMLVCHDALLTNKISGITDFDYDAFASGGIGLKVFSTCMVSKEYSTFEELVEASISNPGMIRFGTEAATNDTHIIAMMQRDLGTQIQIVDTGAVSNQIAAMMGGHIDFMKAPLGLVKDYVASGEFNVLGFFCDERISNYPEIPTFKEVGLNYTVDKFYYCAFPKDTSPVIIEKFSAALEKVTQNPQYIEDANNILYDVDFVSAQDCPEYFENIKKNLVKSQEVYDSVMGN